MQINTKDGSMKRSAPQEGDTQGCWRGKDDPRPFVPGLPESVPAAETLEELFEAMRCCTRCDLALERTQVVVGAGQTSAPVMLIGEAPGADEDRIGRPFVGRSGRLLEEMLEQAGVARDDVYITNIVACRPPKNRDPRVGEIRAHTPWLEAQIRLVDPVLIVTLGRVALTYFVPGAKITQVHGEEHTIEQNGRSIVLLPLFHPSAAIRRRALLPALEEDFAKIPELLARLR